MIAGLGEGVYEEVAGLVTALANPGQAIEGLKALFDDPSLIKDMAQAEVQEMKDLLNNFETNYEAAGTSGAFNAGQNLGKIAGKAIALIGGIGSGVGVVGIGTVKAITLVTEPDLLLQM